MAKIGRLTALKVARCNSPGMYADGGGLYLQVTVNGKNGDAAKSWIYRYMLRGRARAMGLGMRAADVEGSVMTGSIPLKPGDRNASRLYSKPAER